jgi:hypothetical protein
LKDFQIRTPKRENEFGGVSPFSARQVRLVRHRLKHFCPKKSCFGLLYTNYNSKVEPNVVVKCFLSAKYGNVFSDILSAISILLLKHFFENLLVKFLIIQVVLHTTPINSLQKKNKRNSSVGF